MPGAESFTVLAVLEARNQMSAGVEEANESLVELGGQAKATAESVRVSGEAID